MDYKLAKIDQEDRKILSCLRRNARETLTNISKDTGIPISSIFDRLKRLEKIEIITRYTCLLDMEKVGFSVTVFLFLKIANKRQNEVEKFLMENPNVNNLLRVNGDWNLIVDVLFRDINSFELFADTFKNDFKEIEISIHYVLEDIKRENFLIDNALKNNEVK